MENQWKFLGRCKMKVEDILKIKFPIEVRYASGEEDTAYGIYLMDDYMFTDENGGLSGYVRDAEVKKEI